ncbi:hypothetical protein I350_07494 [Cryptococcus amylolentus CBS 6273]|uniref:Uncharacterized protein n=1 Tax=Cryptococcus amylolentus CBS 6273 TaxID=1296118 RepID=A0A1E3JGT0_9TREE|nr:hypothetical protein I350_07494 [Cryptococcus amylolentus CBS 6273]
MSDDENDRTNTTPSFETNNKSISDRYPEHTHGYASNDLTSAINEMFGNIVETVITEFPELDIERKSALANNMITRDLRWAGMSVNSIDISINGSAFAPATGSVMEEENGAEDEAVEGGLGVENLNIS